MATLEYMAYLLGIEEIFDIHPDPSLDVHKRLSVNRDAATHLQRTMVNKDFNPHSFEAKETATVSDTATALVLLLEAAASRDEAIEYAKETNRDCTKLKDLMKETQRLECERATLLTDGMG